jgi:pyruvate dehydrogenase E1 component
VAQAAVAALAAEGKLTAKDVARTNQLYGLQGTKPNPITI